MDDELQTAVDALMAVRGSFLPLVLDATAAAPMWVAELDGMRVGIETQFGQFELWVGDRFGKSEMWTYPDGPDGLAGLVMAGSHYTEFTSPLVESSAPEVLLALWSPWHLGGAGWPPGRWSRYRWGGGVWDRRGPDVAPLAMHASLTHDGDPLCHASGGVPASTSRTRVTCAECLELSP